MVDVEKMDVENVLLAAVGWSRVLHVLVVVKTLHTDTNVKATWLSQNTGA